MSTEASHLAHHFEDMPKQIQAARLGMWMFLGTEALLFGVLFTIYAYYRFLFQSTFAVASEHLDIGYGTVNTFVLITSSFAVAMGLYFTRTGGRRKALAALLVTIALAALFLVIKGLEWSDDFSKGIYPGLAYAGELKELPGATLFYDLYFLMTGLHGIHVCVGLGVLSWMTYRVGSRYYTPAFDTPLELGAMYWHLVDIIWIFLYPLLYLVT